MSKERLWTPVFIMLLCTGFCATIDGAGVNAGVSVYLDRVGAGAGLAGVGALLFSGASAIARIVSAPVIDKRGRGIVMIAGSLLAVVGTLLPIIDTEGLLFSIGRLVQGFGVASTVTAASTAAADILPMSRLGEGIGYFGIGQALSIAVGPGIAIALANSPDPLSLFFGMSGFAFVMTLLAFMNRYEKHPEKLPETSAYRVRWEKGEVNRKEAGPNEPEPSAQEAAKRESQQIAEDNESRIQRWLKSAFEVKAFHGALPFMIIAPMFGFSLFYMGVYGANLGVGNPGAYYIVVSLSMLIIRFVSGRFMDTTAPIKLMIITVVASLIGFSMALSCSLIQDHALREFVYYAMGIFIGIGCGISMPLCQSVSIKVSPANRWGAATGMFYFAFDIGIGFASLLFGIICENAGYVATLTCVLAFIAASLPVAYLCFPKEANQVEAKKELEE